MSNPIVGILMGSDSDFEIMKESAKVLKDFGVPFEVVVTSAHRTPERTLEYAKSAKKRGLKVLIVGAGMAAHLAGVIAAKTTIPVIGVPINSSSLNGIDALYSTLQMPSGIPVGTMAIGKAGAKNAALYAIQMLALSDKDLSERLENFRKDFERVVVEREKKVHEKLEKFLNE
ncbi:5-(carboxyamino)imidazole ribonucleotide mutase [Thermotomaculum hydrothermale]|uniref:N5-carboxyaminoimidazole ribonucleotide mutase n=1 Tax=Thermotomaculum hydrothermale TaxID=981385 RepID=A0A7R6PZ18_9BACT|nr:5-(carboxyamino)imidazole ribonucleotide mutase [Thermotomaculum hydrothermale]BBB32278.1 5-(carboxyamino)imidazole ribonucleotide mutase [Thermotomaculum hydrothermale]